MKNIKVEIFTLSDYATMSKEGKLSIMGMFDKISLSSFPSNYSQFFIVAVLNGSSNQEFILKLAITTPSDEQALPPKELPVKLGKNGKSNIIISMENFPLKEAGKYSVDLAINGKVVRSTTINVLKKILPKPSKESLD